jgi:hypothetical protein
LPGFAEVIPPPAVAPVAARARFCGNCLRRALSDSRHPSHRKICCGLISQLERAGRLFNGISKFDKRGARPVMVRCSESELEEAHFPASTGRAGQGFQSGPGASP